MPNNSSQHPKVFISYSWDSDEHNNKVVNLANSLRRHGINCHLDRFEISPPASWQSWMLNQIEQSKFVLVVCTEKYKKRFQGQEDVATGEGLRWEGAIANQLICDRATDNKFIPIILSDLDKSYIPSEFYGLTYYSPDNFSLDTDKGYRDLYQRLTNKPRNQKPQPDSIESLPYIPPQPIEDPPSENIEDIANKLNKFYDRVQKLAKNRQWREIVNTFEQIQRENLPYYDPNNLYRSARDRIIEKERRREQERKQLEQLYYQGVKYCQNKNWQEARQTFEKIVREQPSDRKLLADTQDKLGQVRQQLALEKRLLIGSIFIVWLISSFIGSIVGVGIGGFFSGVFIWWVSMGRKQAEPLSKVLKLLLFIFTGVVVEQILWSILKVPLIVSLVGIGLSVWIVFLQMQKH
jgi:hypothetical protein